MKLLLFENSVLEMTYSYHLYVIISCTISFCMTINKRQGHIWVLWVYIFHNQCIPGQLCTACATVHSKRNLSIYVREWQRSGVFDGHKVCIYEILCIKKYSARKWIHEDQSQDENYDVTDQWCLPEGQAPIPWGFSYSES